MLNWLYICEFRSVPFEKPSERDHIKSRHFAVTHNLITKIDYSFLRIDSPNISNINGAEFDFQYPDKGHMHFNSVCVNNNGLQRCISLSCFGQTSKFSQAFNFYSTKRLLKFH